VEYVRFSNIPYAEPPVTDLRFIQSIPPEKENSEINNGSTTKICLQRKVGWFGFAGQFSGNWAGGADIDEKWDYPINPERNYTYPPLVETLPPGGNVFPSLCTLMTKYSFSR
jgi:hypothetical protein